MKKTFWAISIFLFLACSAFFAMQSNSSSDGKPIAKHVATSMVKQGEQSHSCSKCYQNSNQETSKGSMFCKPERGCCDANNWYGKYVGRIESCK